MSEATANLEKYEFDSLVVLKRRTAASVYVQENFEHAFDFPKHQHRQAFFMLIGPCAYQEKLGSRFFNHSTNTVLWRPPEISHKDSITGANGRIFSVYISNELLRSYSDYEKIPGEFSENNTYLVFLANRLRNEFGNWGNGSELVAEGLVLEMLGYTARNRRPAERIPPQWLARITEKLNDEFLDSHTNVELAAEAGVHPVHLARTFRKYHGKSVGAYLREKRIHRAMHLITQNDLGLAEIAYSSGFADQSQLTRAFKQLTGITPGVFRHEVTRSLIA